jgi:hypothetical protein
VSEYFIAAQTIVKPLVSHDRFVLVSIGPVVGAPGGEEFGDLRRFSNEVIGSAGMLERVRDPAAPVPYRAYPTSGLLLETCSSPRVRFAAPRAAQPAIPVLLSLAYRKDSRGRLVTQSGHPPEWFARRAEAFGVVALGVNCGRDIGMDDMIEVVRRYRDHTDLPLFARPNAGTPTRVGDRWVYPHTPEDMAARLPELLEAGVSMVGGCCGTTPAHIATFRRVVDAWNRGRAR